MTSRAPSRQLPHQTDAERAIARAEQDYQRLRLAYLELARGPDKDNELALAMVGADMERANAVLRGLVGLRQLPFTPEPTQAERRQARRLAEEDA